MSSVQQPLTSSGSEGDPQYAVIDERKRKRMLSNRESARRSRLRKQQHLDDLENQVSQLQKQNEEITKAAEVVLENYTHVVAENLVLKARMTELNTSLENMNSLISLMDNTSHLFLNTSGISDPLLNQCQHQFPSQPMMASADLGPIFLVQ